MATSTPERLRVRPTKDSSPSFQESKQVSRRLSPAYFHVDADALLDADPNLTSAQPVQNTPTDDDADAESRHTTSGGGDSKSQSQSERAANNNEEGDGEAPLPALHSRFVPKPGPSVEYVLCIHMDRDYSAGAAVEVGTSHPAVVVSSYPVPTKRHSRLDFEEKCLSIGQFLFPYQLRCVTREELHRDPSLGTTAEPYSFMFVGTDSDYSKFYAHCCVVHVVRAETCAETCFL